MKALFRWAVQAVLFHRVRSVLTVAAIGLASALLMSTLGFNRGYERALKHNIDAMGYQILVTGKGCPHEAATLILRGGTLISCASRYWLIPIGSRNSVTRISPGWIGGKSRFVIMSPLNGNQRFQHSPGRCPSKQSTRATGH